MGLFLLIQINETHCNHSYSAITPPGAKESMSLLILDDEPDGEYCPVSSSGVACALAGSRRNLPMALQRIT